MGGGKSKEIKRTSKVDLTKYNARVDRVNIKGLERTYSDYVSRAVNNLFLAKTFADVLLETNNALSELHELRVFKNVRAHIDVSKGEKATQNGYEVTFEGLELTRITGGIGAELGQNDGSGTAELTTPNIFGRGESLSLKASYSYIKTSELNFKFSKPFFHTILGDYKPETSFTIVKHSSIAPWSKYRLDDFGLLFDFSFLLPFGSHSLQYELGVQELSALDKQTPFFIREHCGPRLASTLRHLYAFDTRDSTVFPTNGFYVKTTTELIGSAISRLGLLKNETHGELNLPLFAGMSVQLCGRLGVLLTDKRKESVPIHRHLFPGGPQTLRGFEVAGVGPHREGVALGCESYWVSGLHLWSPLPFNRYFGGFGNLFRTHFFYNFGSANAFTADHLRSTAGIGLAIRLGERARIEFNYCHPILHQKGDRLVKGFQFGIGFDFV
uniref:Putative sorting and assembly machinery component 50 protein b n=1 Tax=Corethrella appendiculata TaxID=1370023 RepID=U5EM16_9DIPT